MYFAGLTCSFTLSSQGDCCSRGDVLALEGVQDGSSFEDLRTSQFVLQKRANYGTSVEMRSRLRKANLAVWQRIEHNEQQSHSGTALGSEV